MRSQPEARVRPNVRVHQAWLFDALADVLPPARLQELRVDPKGAPWEAAVRKGWTTDDEILTALSARYRVRIANLMSATPQAVKAVPEHIVRRHAIVPLAITEHAIDIAASHPHDLDCERAIGFAVRRTVRVQLAAPAAIRARIDELYRPDNVIEKILDEGFAGVGDLEAITDDAKDSAFELSINKATDRPIIRLVDRIVAKAIQQRASDIHLEPEEEGICVRYRIDGVLRDDSTIPRALGVPLVARVKIMAQLDIADRLRPQDGRACVAVGGTRVDLRISTLPATRGEKVVVRILDGRTTVLSTETLGLPDRELAMLRRLANARDGFVLVTGPTGSGKTTTLYAMLRDIRARGVNIVTVEDPVEYRVPGVVQVQVNERQGLTFTAALRSILRQDPDVILVGEVRDRETAEIAIQAALTGHLVFSTLHTIDAVGAITRLRDLGVEPFKLAAALRGVVAQRLVRRVCPHCRRAAGATCVECGGRGFKGRVAVTEVVLLTPEIEQRIAASVPASQLVHIVRAEGMRSLWDSAMDLVQAGITSMDEVARVVERPLTEPSPYARANALTSRMVRERLPSGDTAVAISADDGLRRILCEAAAEAACIVVEARDAHGAIACIDERTPDVVLLDLALQHDAAFQVLDHLRTRSSVRDIPIIVISPDGNEELEVRAFGHHATTCVAGPVRQRVLAAQIRALLPSRRQVAPAAP
jgi:type II secretory ATPase GspE/PulE/Tfp pilus assembly ATPase PilB-like protein/CheY-like chemotaxis protein